MKLEEWVRKPKPLTAVQVTEENMVAVAAWCKSPISGHEGKRWIAVVFKNPENGRRKAYVGDYVVKLGRGYKIYTAKAFRDDFEPAPVVQYDEEPPPPKNTAMRLDASPGGKRLQAWLQNGFN